MWGNTLFTMHIHVRMRMQICNAHDRMASLDVKYVRHLIETCGFSYADVSRECQLQRPGCRGYSIRTIRRFCAQNNISRMSRIDDSALDRVTALGLIFEFC